MQDVEELNRDGLFLAWMTLLYGVRVTRALTETAQ